MRALRGNTPHEMGKLWFDDRGVEGENEDWQSRKQLAYDSFEGKGICEVS